jgi:hypothetical protein
VSEPEIPASDATPVVRKRCPDCAELVHVDARTCRFCRFNFETGRSADGSQLVAVDDDADEVEETRKGTTLRYELFVFIAFVLTILVLFSLGTGNVWWIVVLAVVVGVPWIMVRLYQSM